MTDRPRAYSTGTHANRFEPRRADESMNPATRYSVEIPVQVAATGDKDVNKVLRILSMNANLPAGASQPVDRIGVLICQPGANRWVTESFSVNVDDLIRAIIYAQTPPPEAQASRESGGQVNGVFRMIGPYVTRLTHVEHDSLDQTTHQENADWLNDPASRDTMGETKTHPRNTLVFDHDEPRAVSDSDPAFESGDMAFANIEKDLLTAKAHVKALSQRLDETHRENTDLRASLASANKKLSDWASRLGEDNMRAALQIVPINPATNAGGDFSKSEERLSLQLSAEMEKAVKGTLYRSIHGIDAATPAERTHLGGGLDPVENPGLRASRELLDRMAKEISKTPSAFNPSKNWKP